MTEHRHQFAVESFTGDGPVFDTVVVCETCGERRELRTATPRPDFEAQVAVYNTEQARG